ncbi:DUF7669 domain-containing protein [Neobacillus niacini]|uniref:DUF7669 domain-containing protein n=1 Tax=Neobacillus niacini TaxID=86668 RepID=UPI003B589CC6
MSIYANCREELLNAVHNIVNKKGKNEFSIMEVIEYMGRENTPYSESTIRTHITSRCCSNAPENHAVVYNDLERIGRGKYKIIHK